MEKIDLVCLCALYNLKESFGEYFAADNSWINLLLPEEVNNPESIQHALAFSLGPKAFEAYPNLRLVSCAGAGVDALLDNPGLKANLVVFRVVIAEQAQMIAGFAIWYIHGWQRRMWEYTSLQSARDWHPINRTPPSAFPVGILGCGKIGGTLARTLQALGYLVTAYGNTSRVEEDLTAISQESFPQWAMAWRTVSPSASVLSISDNIFGLMLYWTKCPIIPKTHLCVCRAWRMLETSFSYELARKN